MIRILKRVCAVAIAVVAAAVVGGALYQRRGAIQDAELYPPPGRLVQVGTHRLHLNCTGEGKPTVLLEALSGGFSTEWAWIQPEIARTTSVCSYDRVGRAWSDPAPPGDLWQTAETLHALVGNAGVDGPYVLAGHSIGGSYVRAFAARYPQEVVGLALIDSSHPEQLDRYPEMAEADSGIVRLMWTFPWMARVGLFRYYFSKGGEIDFQDLPKQQHAEMAAVWSSPRFFESQRDEIALADRILAQAHELGPLGDLPLAVVTAGTQPAWWIELQADLATLSSHSSHLVVDGATHGSLAFNPGHAKQTAAAILGVVEDARASQ